MQSKKGAKALKTNDGVPSKVTHKSPRRVCLVGRGLNPAEDGALASLPSAPSRPFASNANLPGRIGYRFFGLALRHAIYFAASLSQRVFVGQVLRREFRLSRMGRASSNSVRVQDQCVIALPLVMRLLMTLQF